MQYCAIPTMNRLLGRFAHLYGDIGARCFKRMQAMIGRYGIGTDAKSLSSRWSEKDVLLVTYGDMIKAPDEKPLATLNRFLGRRLVGAVNTVHVLPFFPYSSDDGFAIMDYCKVDPALGDWGGIRAIGERFHLMFDLVLNHVSRESAWAQDFVAGIAPARHYFIEMNPKTDLSSVARPRSSPLLTPVQTREDILHVWTTFSEDQLDLNFANPDVLFEFLDILFFYLSQGVRIIRLDAIAYLWKRLGTACIHLPETHEVVRIFRDVLTIVAPEVLLLTETNVPHNENVSYFGRSDEAHMIYQFSLPPLLLHALHTGRTSLLTEWAASVSEPPASCTFLNFTASHDGIGVRPLEGIVPKAELNRLIKSIRKRGGKVAMRRNLDGTESPYELNITYFDALCDPDRDDPDLDVARFLCSQTVPLALRGIPAVYFNSLVAARNDLEGVKQTGRARSINRRKWELQELAGMLENQDSIHSCVFREYVRRLRIRCRHPAFHPDAGQRVLDLGDSVFAIERTAPDGSETIAAISNFTPEPVKLSVDDRIPSLKDAPAWKNLITGKQRKASNHEIAMAPYQTCWLLRVDE